MTEGTRTTDESFEPIQVTGVELDAWAVDPGGPVGLYVRQRLLPIQGQGGVIFPPTYADIGYNIDVLSDGTEVATMDSVGSQANRMEPIFAREPYSKLVPQIEITYGDGKSTSILHVGHRLADAVIRCSTLKDRAQAAFRLYLDKGDASEIARIAPTSLVFGVWDSRDTMARLPRIVQSVIRAWDVKTLTRSATYNPALDYTALGVFSEDDKQKAEGNQKSPLAQRGFVHVPSTARGGVLARGPIEREVILNLVALRRLRVGERGEDLARYILGLSLIAASAAPETFLRQGCLLVPEGDATLAWTLVERGGQRRLVDLPEGIVMEYATTAAARFGVGESETVIFREDLAQADVKKGGK